MGMNDSVNPLLKVSSLRHGAFPFNQLKTEHFEPALEAAITEARANLDKIRNATDTPTFENTILALETASEAVGRVSSVFYNLLHADTNDALQALAQKLAPKLADFSSDVLLDAKIFSRVKAVWDSRSTNGLTQDSHAEEMRLTEKTYKDFVRNGALLSDEKKAQLRALDQEMSKLAPQFSENVLKATNAFELWIDDENDLVGLPANAIEAAMIAATEKGEAAKGKWLFTLQITSYLPFMTYSERRELREKMYRAYSSRAYRGDFSNIELTKKIALLRHQRAELLGNNSHAQFVLQERMAESPEKAMAFLERILEKAKPAAERDLADVRELKAKETGDADFQPWDYTFWAEKLKMKLHDLDDEVLRPYFKLENVIEGVFEHARRLYGLSFKEVTDIPKYHPDVRVFEVSDTKKNSFIGLFYTDFFPRPSKQGGAWANSIREQGLQGGKIERPHATIVCNFPKSTPTTPSLLSLDDVRTMFHEFGHALHSLLSDTKFVSLGGTNVYWDFVELPSQIMENWAIEEEGLNLFARHYQTGEKMPRELIQKIQSSSRFQAGWFTMRQLVFGMLDLAWHSADPSKISDIAEFERKVTSRATLLPQPEGANMSSSFSHIFAGGYSAGYYSYKWAEVLDADAFELFKEKGLFNEEVAMRFRENILSRGGTKHPMELYKQFRGREPDPDALLRRDGLI
jgi:peptidyl-dipeptidase Dcp